MVAGPNPVACRVGITAPNYQVPTVEPHTAPDRKVLSENVVKECSMIKNDCTLSTQLAYT